MSDIDPSSLKNALDEYHEGANAILQPFVHGVNAEEPTPVIFHYTNDRGLRGILESGKIWLTDVFSLNDPSELRHGLEHAVKHALLKAKSGSPVFQAFAHIFSDFPKLGVDGSGDYFTFSLSKDEDELGQWRAYGDDGRGYAIGFDARALDKAFSCTNGFAFPVKYDDTLLNKIQEGIIDAFYDAINPLPKELFASVEGKELFTEAAAAVTVDTITAAVLFKHEDYKNEQEYRLLRFFRDKPSLSNLKLRMRPYTLVRYIEFDWRAADSSMIKRIVIGPSADKAKSEKFALDCIREFHKRDVELSLSIIPYRSLLGPV